MGVRRKERLILMGGMGPSQKRWHFSGVLKNDDNIKIYSYPTITSNHSDG